MDFDKINADQICSVKSVINEKCNEFTHKKQIKIFSFLLQKEGYYKWGHPSHTLMTKEEIESKYECFCKDEIVYLNTHLEIKMSNGNIHTKFFKTEEDLKEFTDTFLMNLNLIDA